MTRLLIVFAIASSACTVFGGAASSSNTGNKGVRTVISSGNLSVRDGRLYFSAWAFGADDAAATLRGPGIAEQTIEMKDNFGVKQCQGTLADRRGGTVDYDAACSFDLSGAGPGRYRLAVMEIKEQRELASLDFDLVETPVGINRSALMVPAEGPSLDHLGPAIDVVPVAGPAAPRDKGDAPPHTLLVFRDGVDLVGSFEMTGPEILQVPLTPIAAPAAAIVDVARMRANKAMHEGHPPQFLDLKYPEPVACAVRTDRKAFEAFKEMKRGQNAAHWAWYDAAVAHDTALDDRVTERQRGKLKQRMVDKAKERAAELEGADANQTVLLAEAKRFGRGCLAEYVAGTGTAR